MVLTLDISEKKKNPGSSNCQSRQLGISWKPSLTDLGTECTKMGSGAWVYIPRQLSYYFGQRTLYNMMYNDIVLFLGCDRGEWGCGQIFIDPAILPGHFHQQLQENHRSGLFGKTSQVRRQKSHFLFAIFFTFLFFERKWLNFSAFFLCGPSRFNLSPFSASKKCRSDNLGAKVREENN